MRRQGTNSFFMRDMFLLSWVERDADGLRRLRELILGADWPEWDSIQAARREANLVLVERGIRALEGEPGPLVARVDSLVAQHDARVAMGEDTDLRFDLLWVWSMLYAWVGETEKALDLYVRALDAEVIYVPHTYRYGLRIGSSKGLWWLEARWDGARGGEAERGRRGGGRRGGRESAARAQGVFDGLARCADGRGRRWEGNPQPAGQG